MRLESLKLVEGRQRRIGVVQVNHKTDDDLIFLDMIEERATTSFGIQRPPEGMLHQPWPVQGRINLPQLLDAEAILLRLAALVQLEAGDDLLGQRPSRALGEKRVFSPQLHASSKRVFRLRGGANARVAGSDSEPFALLSEQDFGCSEARIDFNAERFCFGAEIAADIAQRTDKIPVIVQQRRHEEIWQPDAAGGAEQIELVLGDRYFERTVGIFAPARKQFVEANR